MPRQETIVDVQGHRLALSNLEKVLYPDAGFTKPDVIDYYTRIGRVMLPHLEGRPLTLKRYPNGVAGMHFYEKNCPRSRPEWVETARVWSEGNHRWMDYCMAQNLASLAWAANLASLELHTSLSKASAMPQPSFVVFDLDPGEPASIVECCQVGRWIHDALERLGLRSFAKTSGSKGLARHPVMPRDRKRSLNLRLLKAGMLALVAKVYQLLVLSVCQNQSAGLDPAELPWV